MGKEEIKQYEEELCTETIPEGFLVRSEKIFTTNRDLDKVNEE